MPISTPFQDLGAIVHHHMACKAHVEPSAMLLDRVTGKRREVDVVIRAEIASHETMVSVEVREQAVPQCSTLIEEMRAKHADLETDQLILYSKSGFTGPAREKAKFYGIPIFTPQAIGDEGRY